MILCVWERREKIKKEIMIIVQVIITIMIIIHMLKINNT